MNNEKTIPVAELKRRVTYEKDYERYIFECFGIGCHECLLYGGFAECCGHAHNYDWNAIKAHQFDKTEVTIDDLKQFKLLEYGKTISFRSYPFCEV